MSPSLSKTAALLAAALGITAGCALASAAPVELVARRECADDPDVEAFHRVALVKYLARLDALAQWCAEQQLFLERDRVWRSMLEINPDNEAARKGLRYSKSPDGSWKEPAPRESKNRNPAALAELPKQRAAALETFKSSMLSTLEKSTADAAQRKRVYAEILLGDPDDTTVRLLQGEAKLDDAWVLQETAVAKKRRGEIKECAAAVLALDIAPKKGTLTAFETRAGIPFSNVLELEGVRVLVTGDPAEALRAVRVCQAVGPFLRAILGFDTPARPGWTLYLLADTHQVDPLLAALPDVTAELRDSARKLNGALIPGQPMAVYWEATAPRRLDAGCRQTIADFLARTYGLSVKHGWAWEGLGNLLARELTGTQLTFYVAPDTTAKQARLRKQLLAPDANWMKEISALLQSDPHPSLAELLEKDVAAMHVEDALYAHAFAAYLLEGYPSELPEILRRLGQENESSAQALKAVLNRGVPELEERFTRWLAERR